MSSAYLFSSVFALWVWHPRNRSLTRGHLTEKEYTDLCQSCGAVPAALAGNWAKRMGSRHSMSLTGGLAEWAGPLNILAFSLWIAVMAMPAFKDAARLNSRCQILDELLCVRTISGIAVLSEPFQLCPQRPQARAGLRLLPGVWLHTGAGSGSLGRKWSWAYLCLASWRRSCGIKGVVPPPLHIPARKPRAGGGCCVFKATLSQARTICIKSGIWTQLFLGSWPCFYDNDLIIIRTCYVIYVHYMLYITYYSLCVIYVIYYIIMMIIIINTYWPSPQARLAWRALHTCSPSCFP